MGINAKMANSLSIRNCINCDNMILYCPQNGAYSLDNTCNLEILSNIHGLTVYAQESFNDFSIISNNHNISSSSIHCGDLSMIEFQCTLNNEGNSCTDPTKLCQNYRIPTSSPTHPPSIS